MSKNVDFLVTELKTLAVEMGESTSIGDVVRSNELNEKLTDIATELRVSWPENSLELESLLAAENEEFVRLWTAITLLPICEQVALDELENLKAERSIVSLSARALLDLHSKGLA